MDTDTATGRSTAPLAGLRILVTRAAEQAEPLCRMIEAAGGEALRAPAMEIKEIGPDASLDALIDRLDGYDLAIFISPNAVETGLARVLSRRAWPQELRRAAVGRVTAQTLRQHGLPADIFPLRESNSEALLALTVMQNMAGKRIVIFRGRGGREWLRDTLVARGATVDYAEIYRRVRPANSPDALRKSPDLITVHSRAALENLLAMTGATADALREIPLALGNPRLAGSARALGFTRTPAVATAPGDEILFAAILEWAAARTDIRKSS